jgi:hypothetical protein
MKNLAVIAGILLLTALTWFAFPGHTWLQQDTQIYVAILKHLRNPAVLRHDILVEHPHVTFTLYDEIARGLARATGLGFHEVLEGEQLLTRALGVGGLYLMATAAGASPSASLLVAGILSLGATIGGPAVLSMEIEPDPRGFAVPLLLLAMGLAAHGRRCEAAMAAAAAFLLHPPTVIPFWIVYLCLLVWRREWIALAPLAAAAVILSIAARYQQGAGEAQIFLARLAPFTESLQRLRAPYSYISEWWREWLPHYVLLYTASVVAYLRMRAKAPLDLQIFLAGLPLVGILSVPTSYLLLEKMKWALLPQIQPMRALLFVTVMAEFSGALAGVAAVRASRYVEACGWFTVVYLVPIATHVDRMPSWRQTLVIALLAAGACGAAWAEARRYRRSAVVMAGVAAAAFFLIPGLGGVRMYPRLHTPELTQLAGWARAATPPDAVFLFPDLGKQLEPGIFRAKAERAVYVDWKSGGQVNYREGFGHEWWSRWQRVMAHRPLENGDVAAYRALGIDFVVRRASDRMPGRAPVFGNSGYLVYSSAP